MCKKDFPKGNRYFETDNGILYNTDVLYALKQMPDNSVDCVVTSPPYWALRDYGVEEQLGLEPTFKEYLDKLWKIFDEVYRVLKPTGTCWVNLGDTYNGNKIGNDDLKNKKVNTASFKKNKIANLKTKSLCLVPERFAIGMVDRGWILRNEIIWHKFNAMPSSVKDRFTVDFEKIFFFVKSKKYYFKQQFEKAVYNVNRTLKSSGLRPDEIKANGKGGMAGTYSQGRNKRTVWHINTKPFKDSHFAVFPEAIPKICINAGCPENGVVLDPFMGSGTTALVAEKLCVKWIGIELNPEYCEIAINKRLKKILEEKNGLFKL